MSEIIKGRTANQLWKESGTTLPFKVWIEREKEKSLNADGTGTETIMINSALNDSINSAISQLNQQTGNKDAAPTDNTILGLNKTVVIFSAIIIVVAIGYGIYRKTKNKKT